MADVTGPISTLPGARYSAPAGVPCDRHPDRMAVCRIQGETDSMGSEMHDLCAECRDEIAQHEREARIGKCDWCKEQATDLRHRRDFEEGTSGPVYEVCGACVKRENERLNAERAEQEDLDDYDFD